MKVDCSIDNIRPDQGYKPLSGAISGHVFIKLQFPSFLDASSDKYVIFENRAFFRCKKNLLTL